MPKFLVLFAVILAPLAWAQNRQSPYSTANRVIQQAGAPSSSLCQVQADVGRVYIQNDVKGSANPLSSCSQTGVGTYSWVAGGGGSVSSATDCLATVTSATVVTIATPCQIVDNNVVALTLTGNCIFTLSGGPSTGYLYVYFLAGALKGGYSTSTITGNANCSTTTGITGFPDTSDPLWTLHYTSNVWDTITAGTSGVDARFSYRSSPVTGDAATINCSVNGSTGLKTCNVISGVYSLLIATGAKALATGAIASATCTTAQTLTATGTLTTDVIVATFNGDPTGVTGYVPLTTGGLTIYVYPTADTVNIKVCNFTSSSITPGAITLNIRVLR